MRYKIVLFLVACIACQSSVLAADAETLKAQLLELRQEKSRINADFDRKIAEVERQIFEIQGPLPTWVENSSEAERGFIDFNVYFDTENYSVATANIGAKLPNNFSYFSLNNFFNAFGDSDYTEFESLYSEQNLTWSPPETSPIAWNIQWNVRSGADNDRLRLAPQWLLHKTPGLKDLFKFLNMTYKINFHAVQWDDETHGDYVWQMEHVYYASIFPELFDDRIYLSGFADHTFGGPNNPALVTEHQLGVRVIDNWYAVAEYRRNEYRKGNEDSLGLGVEYKILFR